MADPISPVARFRVLDELEAKLREAHGIAMLIANDDEHIPEPIGYAATRAEDLLRESRELVEASRAFRSESSMKLSRANPGRPSRSSRTCKSAPRANDEHDDETQ